MSEATTQAEVRELFEYHEDGYLVWRMDRGARLVRGRRAGGATVTGYRVTGFGRRRRETEHRLIFLWHHGFLPPEVDHIDQNKKNNRISNLRAATKAENRRNQSGHAGRAAKWKGVYRNGKHGFMATITKDGTAHYLGTFKNEEDAALAYNFAAAELHGEFAALNLAEQTCPLLSEVSGD